MWGGYTSRQNFRRVTWTGATSLFEIAMTVVDILVSVSSEGDLGLSAHERHQLILSEDEEFLGIAMVYDGSQTKEDLAS